MHCVITELLIVFSIDVYMERLSAYVGIGDGDSEGEHDRKHQSDMAWLIVFITQSGVLCFFLSLPPLLCSYCIWIALQIITPINAATTYNYFLQHDCIQNPRCLMSLCSLCQFNHFALWLLEIAFVQSKHVKHATMGWSLR